ncbi:hypothetical protein [Thalassospira tepidiphila]|uniref:hypothetical protein n=1 Tax=Thalassospira tepidiphila TaxID=393657 RepID=UPI003AA90FFD
MREALKRLVVDENATGITKTTLKGLIARDLLTDDGQLTDSGYQSAIALLPLAKQCELLDIPLIQGRCETPMGHEIAVLMALDEAGVECSAFDEGLSILAALHATLRPYILANPCVRDEMFVFASLSVIRREIGDESYRQNISPWLSDNRPDHAGIAQSARNLRVIETSKKKASIRLASVIADDIKGHVTELTSFLDRPYSAQSGWPDIAYLDGGKIKFIEVKASDKLISSQIYNILALPKFLAKRLLVIKVVKKDSELPLSQALKEFLYDR